MTDEVMKNHPSYAKTMRQCVSVQASFENRIQSLLQHGIDEHKMRGFQRESERIKLQLKLVRAACNRITHYACESE